MRLLIESSLCAFRTGWGVSPRGAGYLFGSDVVAQFNATNLIELICRAHQLVMEGYKWHFNQTVLTVWSAPNYCYRCGNVAAILELDENLERDFTIFEAAPQVSLGVFPWILAARLDDQPSNLNLTTFNLTSDQMLTSTFLSTQENRGVPCKKPQPDYFL